MTYLSRRTREIREEDAIPASVRIAEREGATVRFMGHRVDAITAHRMSIWPPVGELVSYRGRGA